MVTTQERIDARSESRNVESMCGVVLGRDAVSPHLAATDPEGENPMRAIRECCGNHGGGRPGEVRLDEHQSVRNAGNQRRYHRSMLRRISVIRVAQGLGLTLAEIDDALGRLLDGKTPTRRDWERLSRIWRRRLDVRIAELEGLRDKLTSCIGCGCLSLKSCALYNTGDRAAGHGPGPRYLLGDSPERGPAAIR